MKPAGLRQNPDGTWTAWVYGTEFTGTRAECVGWLAANGETP